MVKYASTESGKVKSEGARGRERGGVETSRLEVACCVIKLDTDRSEVEI